jgi:hypothetical protein
MKWETKSMSFLEKVQLALESICGVATSISLERKKLLVPDVDWEEALLKLEKKAKQKKGGGGSGPGSTQDKDGRREDAAKRLNRIQQRHQAKWRGLDTELKEGQIWMSGSEPQLRYKKYISSSKSGNWGEEGTTFLPADNWNTAKWMPGGEGQLPKIISGSESRQHMFQDGVHKVERNVASHARDVATNLPENLPEALTSVARVVPAARAASKARGKLQTN